MEVSKHKVAIIGAGVAGCAVAGALKDYGIEFVVFDKNDRAGGLWVDNYPGASVQSTFELYEYPCKKFPETIRHRKDPPAPTAQEMCEYLDGYIDEKDMRARFRFNRRVSSISCKSETEWFVEFDDAHTKRIGVEKFTFVVIANGLVSCKPNIINILGKKTFQDSGGTILHSSERRSDDIFVGKKVLIVGNGKSATDAAAAAAKIAKENGTKAPIQMARQQTWYVPRYILGFLQYKWAFHTRIGSALLPRYFETTSLLLRVLHFICIPVKWFLWRVVEALLLIQFRLPFRIWPKIGTVEMAALENSVLITDEKHLRNLRKGYIDLRIGVIDRLEPGKAILDNGKEEEVDVVILATGWKRAVDLFINEENESDSNEDNFRKDCIDISDDGLWLFRNILPTGSKGLAFVGSNTLTFMNIFTAYIQAYWLTQLLAGVRPWPEEVHMKETVQREKAFKRQYYPFSEMRGASIELYMQHYHDVLFREMDARSPFNCAIRPFADLFVPVLPSLMKGCLEPLVMGGNSSKKNQNTEEEGNDESVTSFSADESHSPLLILHVHENETPSQQQLRAMSPYS